MMSKNNSRIQPQPADEAWITRRAFARTAFGGGGLCYAAAVGYPVFRYLKSPVQKAQAAAAVTEVTLKEAPKLPAGSALMFKFGVEPCLLIHHADGSWVALSARCTHLGCTVQFEPARNRIFCACHGGTYNPATGQNLSGPPPKPLKRFVVKEVGEAGVTVTRA
jgi:cytochrome b6-f complex iron-sulfur subunit